MNLCITENYVIIWLTNTSEAITSY
jgi:hypothetical protein